MTQRIILAGSTGLVGKGVALALSRKPATQLTNLVRIGSLKPGPAIDFEQLCAEPVQVLEAVSPDGLDVAISCLGTTQKTAGSQAGFFRVDHDYVLALAQGAKALGARQFILVSAALAGGPGFYLKTKGQIEEAVTDLGFLRLDIIRPGFLVGDRPESRPAEQIGQRLAQVLSPLLLGPLARFGAIPGTTVAHAVAALAGVQEPGRFIHENDDIRRMGPGT